MKSILSLLVFAFLSVTALTQPETYWLPPKPESNPVSQPPEISSTKIFDLTPEQFRDSFNSQVQAATHQTNYFNIGEIKISKGDKGDSFTIQLTDKFIILGFVDQQTQKILDILITASGGTKEAAQDMVDLPMIVVTALDSTISPERRKEVVLQLFSDAFHNPDKTYRNTEGNLNLSCQVIPSLKVAQFSISPKSNTSSEVTAQSASVPSTNSTNQINTNRTISSYSILDRRFRSNGSHTFEVSIVPVSGATPDKSELESIAQKIIDSERTWNNYIEFYLPGQYTGAGTDQPYADAVFTPKPVVTINTTN
ncbi:MAG: hypothetical protein WCP60_06190 [bacterium]